MENKIILSEQEKEIITRLNDNIYDVEFIEEWINRNDNVEANALSALQAMGAKGYYKAIQNMIQCENKINIQNDEQTSENELMENNTTKQNKETDQTTDQKKNQKSILTVHRGKKRLRHKTQRTI